MPTTYMTLVLSDDTEFCKPFIGRARPDETIVVGGIDQQVNVNIHATKDQWAALANYCLDCVEALVYDEHRSAEALEQDEAK